MTRGRPLVVAQVIQMIGRGGLVAWLRRWGVVAGRCEGGAVDGEFDAWTQMGQNGAAGIVAGGLRETCHADSD